MPVFKTGAINRSANSPSLVLQRWNGNYQETLVSVVPKSSCGKLTPLIVTEGICAVPQRKLQTRQSGTLFFQRSARGSDRGMSGRIPQGVNGSPDLRLFAQHAQLNPGRARMDPANNFPDDFK